MLRGLTVAQAGEGNAAHLRRRARGFEPALLDGRILGRKNLSKKSIGPRQLAGVERCARFALQPGHVRRITGSGTRLLPHAVIVLRDLDQPRRLLLCRNISFAKDAKEGLQSPGADAQLGLKIADDPALVVRQLLLALQRLRNHGELFRRDAGDRYRGVMDVASRSDATRGGDGVCEAPCNRIESAAHATKPKRASPRIAIGPPRAAG